jgi:hypothetical protein
MFISVVASLTIVGGCTSGQKTITIESSYVAQTIINEINTQQRAGTAKPSVYIVAYGPMAVHLRYNQNLWMTS